jgi:hypothetical protein
VEDVVKKTALAATLVILMAVAAEAQITVTYTRRTSNSRLTLSYQGGAYSQYGYGGTGYGGYAGYYGTYRSAVAPGVVAGGYHPWGVGYGYGYPGSTYTYYSGAVRPIMDYAPAVPRSPENVTSLLLDQARKRLRMGDYRGAVEDIRSAVVADTGGGTSEAWFAVALAIGGDVRNADKALRSALGHGFRGRLELQLRDKKEEARVTAALLKAEGEATAYALSLLGQPEKLEKLAEKTAALKPLLPPAAK